MANELRNGDALKVFCTLAEEWRLNSSERASILAITPGEYSDLAKFSDHKASSNLLTRIAMLASIQKAVELFAPTGQSRIILTSPNYSAPLNGSSIREYLLTKNTDADVETLVRWLNGVAYGK